MERGGQHCCKLLLDGLIGLTEELAPFAMANDHVLAVLSEHRDADFTGERTFRLPVHVLCTDPDSRTLHYLMHR